MGGGAAATLFFFCLNLVYVIFAGIDDNVIELFGVSHYAPVCHSEGYRLFD
jgi:hypothetical protein